MDDNGTPLLSDFGRSKFIDHRGFTTAFAGSARYMAPELTAAEPDVVYGEDAHGIYEEQGTPNLTKETDVFAFSMLALEVSNIYLGFEVLFCSFRTSARFNQSIC